MAEDDPPTAEVPHDDAHGKKEEAKPKTTLESVISELGNFAKKAVAIGAVAALPFVYNYFDPLHVRNAQVVSYSLAASKVTSNLMENRPALEGTVRNSFNGALLSYPTAKAFGALNGLEPNIAAAYGNGPAKAAKTGMWMFGVQPMLATGNTALNYGIGKEFRKQLWPRVKATFKYLGLLGGLNAAYISSFGLFPQMAAASTLWYAFGLIQSKMGGKGSMKNLVKNLNPADYANAAVSGTSKLIGNTGKGLTDVIYGLGKTIDSYLGPSKSATKGAEPAHPAGGDHHT